MPHHKIISYLLHEGIGPITVLATFLTYARKSVAFRDRFAGDNQRKIRHTHHSV